MSILETLKVAWRPTLAATLIIILWIHFIIAPLIGAVAVVPLPAEFWVLFTAFAGVYGAGRSWEKTKTKE